MSTCLRVSAALLAGLLSALLWAAEPAIPYNEVFGADGQLRPQYQKIWPIYSKMTEEEKRRFLQKTLKDFKGDNALDPLPRVLTESEFKLLERSTIQRATAIWRFLQDHYSGKKSYRSVLSEETVRKIIVRSGEAAYEGLVKPELISFPSGSDVAHIPEGFRYLEDNPGFIGGVGDLLHARHTLLKNKPEYRAVLQAKNNSMEYFRQLVEKAKAEAVPPGGKIVVYMVPPYPDNEDLRIRELYASLGVETVTPFTKKKLKVRPEGVFLGGEPVGYIILDTEHRFADVTHPATFESRMLYEAQAHLDETDLAPKVRKEIKAAMIPDPVTGRVDLKRLRKAIALSPYENESEQWLQGQSAKGLIDAILKGKVATNYTPGIDFTGDKEFYTYVDDLIRFYMKEEPVISNVTTYRFAANGQLDKSLFAKVFDDEAYKNFVIKAVDGRGGDSVWIGPKLSPGEASRLMAEVRAHPDQFIAQDFKLMSRLDDRIVDLRMIAQIGPKGVLVSATPWSRGIPFSGSGKVNLSLKGHNLAMSGREVAVIVVEDPKPSSSPRECLLRNLH